jgi:hypothetical protein
MASLENENETVYFLSHYQAESKDIALEFFYSMKERGIKCWLDVKMDSRDEDAMREGIKLCEIVLIIMSPSYFTRPFCVKELEWAVEFEKPIVVVIDVQQKGEIGNILGRCPADKSYLRGIGGINFNEVFRGNPKFWEASMEQIVEAKPKILKRDGTAVAAYTTGTYTFDDGSIPRTSPGSSLIPSSPKPPSILEDMDEDVPFEGDFEIPTEPEGEREQGGLLEGEDMPNLEL